MTSLSHLAVAEKFYYSLEFYKLSMLKKKEVGCVNLYSLYSFAIVRPGRQVMKVS